MEHKQSNIFAKHENSISLIQHVPLQGYSQVISCSIDKKAYLWDVELCIDLFEFKSLTAPVSGIEFHEKQVIMACKDGTMALYSL